jgi:integrase
VRGHIRKRGSKWCVVVDVGRDENGKRRQKWHSGFDRKTDAEAALTKFLGQVNDGTYVEPNKQTVGEFLLQEWLPARKASLRPSTHASYERNIKTHIDPTIGGTQLQRLTPAALNALYGSLGVNGRRDGKPLAPRTIRYVHTILRKALHDAVRWGKLVRNPADASEPPSARATQPKAPNAWTADDLRRFLLSARNDRLYPMWLLFATTGMRRGEVAGLTWADVDLNAARIAVTRARVVVGYKVDNSAPKSDRGRRNIALDSATVAALRDWQVRQFEERFALGEAYQVSPLVFTWEDGRSLHPDWISKAFKRKTKAFGLPVLSVHGLRHTAASLALAAGVHPKVVSERLGHSTVSLTLDTYSHAIPALQESAAELMAQLVLGDAHR